MTLEKLKELDAEKKQCIYDAAEVFKFLNILEEFKESGYVENLLRDEYTRLRKRIDSLHNQMFPSDTPTKPKEA